MSEVRINRDLLRRLTDDLSARHDRAECCPSDPCVVQQRIGRAKALLLRNPEETT